MEQFDGIVEINKENSTATTIKLEGSVGNLSVGGSNEDGDILVNNASGEITIGLNGESGNVVLGNNGTQGKAKFMNSKGLVTGVIEAGAPELDDQDPGYNPPGGEIKLYNYLGENTVHIDGGEGHIHLGSEDVPGHIFIGRPGNNEPKITLNGNTGDIILSNADFAEDFDVLADCKVEPGTVMVLDGSGSLQACTEAYDTKVAGVVAGAGKYKPGIIMDKHEDSENRQAISLCGKVACKVDASYGEIKIGDLLTTSARVGYAMKAQDRNQSFGAVIGKALEPLDKGTGMISMLICLQ